MHDKLWPIIGLIVTIPLAVIVGTSAVRESLRR